jgi:hypothetical protein
MTVKKNSKLIKNIFVNKSIVLKSFSDSIDFESQDSNANVISEESQMTNAQFSIFVCFNYVVKQLSSINNNESEVKFTKKQFGKVHAFAEKRSNKTEVTEFSTMTSI